MSDCSTSPPIRLTLAAWCVRLGALVVALLMIAGGGSYLVGHADQVRGFDWDAILYVYYVWPALMLLAFAAPLVAGYGFGRPNRMAHRLAGLPRALLVLAAGLTCVGLIAQIAWIVWKLVADVDLVDYVQLVMWAPAVASLGLAGVECGRWATRRRIRRSTQRRRWRRCGAVASIVARSITVIAAAVAVVCVFVYIATKDRWHDELTLLLAAAFATMYALAGGVGLSRLTAGLRTWIGPRRRFTLLEAHALILPGAAALTVTLFPVAIWPAQLIDQGPGVHLMMTLLLGSCLFATVSGIRLRLRRERADGVVRRRASLRCASGRG